MLKQLKQVQRYRARYQMRDGTSVVAERATLDGIYSRIAWWLIVDKRGDIWAVNRVRVMECDCYPYGWHATPDEDCGPKDCELHDRKTGYFRRLHDRIVRWLKAGYIQPALDAPLAAE